MNDSEPVAQRAFSTRRVLALTGLSAAKVRRFVEAGILSPEAGPDGRPRFGFEDVALLRSLASLRGAQGRRVRWSAALERLGPEGVRRVGLRVDGATVVARDEAGDWEPETGQAVLAFDQGQTSESSGHRAVVRDLGGIAHARLQRQIEQRMERAHRVEGDDPTLAEELYAEVLRLDPCNTDALIDAGRLRHVAGDLERAVHYYERALREAPEHATARFNLGVAFEDLGRYEAALDQYRQAVDLQPELADAHYNAARLCQSRGDELGALRYLRQYRRLVPDGS